MNTQNLYHHEVEGTSHLLLGLTAMSKYAQTLHEAIILKILPKGILLARIQILPPRRCLFRLAIAYIDISPHGSNCVAKRTLLNQHLMSNGLCMKEVTRVILYAVSIPGNSETTLRITRAVCHHKDYAFHLGVDCVDIIVGRKLRLTMVKWVSPRKDSIISRIRID